MSIDKQVQLRSLVIFSICSLCKKCKESTFHLFFEYYVALKIWSWLRQAFFNANSLVLLLILYTLLKLKVVLLLKKFAWLLLLFFYVCVTWKRIILDFNKNIYMKAAINIIKGYISLSSKSSIKIMKNNINDFFISTLILQLFKLFKRYMMWVGLRLIQLRLLRDVVVKLIMKKLLN